MRSNTHNPQIENVIKNDLFDYIRKNSNNYMKSSQEEKYSKPTDENMNFFKKNSMNFKRSKKEKIKVWLLLQISKCIPSSLMITFSCPKIAFFLPFAFPIE